MEQGGLANRMHLELELGQFDQLDRLVDAMRITPPGSIESMFAALAIALAARVSGAVRHLEVAEAAGDGILTAANSPTVVA